MKKKRRSDPDDDLRVSINPHRLDEEWRSHPDRMQKVGDLLADATDRVDRMKSALELAEAEVELRVRKKPGAFGLEKATDASVKAVVACSDEVKEVTHRLNRAKHKAALLKSLYLARQDVRPSLENLVKLYLAGYFGDPKAPKGATRDHALSILMDDTSRPMERKRRKVK